MATKKKTADTVKKAQVILSGQKREYQRIFASEVKKSKDPKEGAKKAGRVYRESYGNTATARWQNALKKAKGTENKNAPVKVVKATKAAVISNTNKPAKFEVGKMYYTHSLANYDTIITIKVIKRTPKTVTIKELSGWPINHNTFRVHEESFGDKTEWISLGNYSMAPVVRASRITNKVQ